MESVGHLGVRDDQHNALGDADRRFAIIWSLMIPRTSYRVVVLSFLVGCKVLPPTPSFDAILRKPDALTVASYFRSFWTNALCL